MTDGLTLGDVLARGIAIDWHEAVAVVRGVADALKGTSRSNAVPELQQIVLSTDGSVSVSGGGSSQEPVRRLGQLLQAMLNGSEPPVQLRLAISQATAPIPTYASIEHFDEALAYFERPGRQALIAGVYRRAVAAPVRQSSGSAPTLDAMAPLPSTSPSAENASNTRKPNNPRVERVTAVAAVLVLAVGIAAVYAARSARANAKISSMTARAAAKVGDSIINGMSFLTERVGLGRLVSAEGSSGEPAPAVAPATPRTPKPPVENRAPRIAIHTGSATEARDVAAKHSVATPTSNTTARPEILAVVPMPGSDKPFAAFDLESAPVAEHRAADVETIIVPVGRLPQHPPSADEPMYAANSDGVTPPVALRPQLPRELPPHTRRSDIRQIDLVISPNGTVESVKLVGVPRNVHDSMLLSAVKAWEFIPALKDGVAVRYRKTITVAPRN
jgi:hypothetical protein